MKLGITGSNGLLGSSLIKIAKKQNIDVVSIKRETLDWASTYNTVEYLASLEFDVLIHCAANRDVEFCEANPEKCTNDNVTLTKLLLDCSRPFTTSFIFISSTGIYGNYQEEPYKETDKVKPTTCYHGSKWSAEKLVRKIGINPLIIRTGWLFGGGHNISKNFVLNRIREAETCNGVIYSDVCQRGNPTFVDDFARCILQIISRNHVGTFNCVNQGIATRYDYVSEIIRLAVPDVIVEPVENSFFDRLAKVSSNESAVNGRLKAIGFKDMPIWQDSLRQYIESLDFANKETAK